MRLERPAANQLQQTVDAATGDERATFTYDTLGDRTQTQPTAGDPLSTPVPTAYDYDQAGRPTAVTKAATSPTQPAIDADYAYDGDGLRSDPLWDRGAGLPEILADEHGLYVTGPDGLPLEQLRYDGTRRFYHHDQLGSTRALTDTTGTVVTRSDYTPTANPPRQPTRPTASATPANTPTTKPASSTCERAGMTRPPASSSPSTRRRRADDPTYNPTW